MVDLVVFSYSDRIPGRCTDDFRTVLSNFVETASSLREKTADAHLPTCFPFRNQVCMRMVLQTLKDRRNN
jgi:hypothetical protein